jgi:N-acetylglucosaminyldiphosphoundecaprenol N-acetyl-beta-D-mannosaminyltransferase
MSNSLMNECCGKRLWLGPVRCTDISRENLVRELVNAEECAPLLFFNLNAHALNLILKTPALAEIWNASHLTFCDGFGVILLNHLFGRGKLRHRMTPPDFVDEVYVGLHDRGGKVFFVGDEKSHVQSYALGVETRFPGLVAGWHDGFFEFGSDTEGVLIEEINAKKPDLLLIGMGMPRQELWAAKNKERLLCKRVLSVGALFSWGVTNRRRGPRWATDRGFEWLVRLCLEPGRVWKRYLIGLPEVAIRLLAFQILNRADRKRG